MIIRKHRRNIKRKEPVKRRIARGLRSKIAVQAVRAGLYSVTAILVVFIFWSVYNWLGKSPYFAIKEVKIAGNARVSRAEILEMAGVNTGDNLLKISSAEIVKGIKINTWVSDVNITRKFPDRLCIEIRERIPVAFINLNGLYFVDEEGNIFKKTSLGDDIDLPVITGITREDIEQGTAVSEMAIKAVNLVHLLAKKSVFVDEELSEINIDKIYGLTLYTMQQGTRIDIGYEDFTEKLVKLNKVIQSRHGFTGVEFIGLNYNRGVVVRLTS